MRLIDEGPAKVLRVGVAVQKNAVQGDPVKEFLQVLVLGLSLLLSVFLPFRPLELCPPRPLSGCDAGAAGGAELPALRRGGRLPGAKRESGGGNGCGAASARCSTAMIISQRVTDLLKAADFIVDRCQNL